jgi:tetratricopeptide (TPR) repeat protein
MSTRTLSLGLFLLVLVCYWPLGKADFLCFDDPFYVTANPRIQEGLTWAGVQWALGAGLKFASQYADYWQPVTFLSRMVDIELFGLEPALHHLENVIIHAINTILLLGWLAWVTGDLRRSALVAVIFAIHPVHVEAVAWVTERKEMLGGFFWMLTLWAYAWYAKSPGPWRYTMVLTGFALGLMSKPVGMILPLILLLLDIWPLKRMTRDSAVAMFMEKAPMMALAMVLVTLVLRVQGEHLATEAVGSGLCDTVLRYATYTVKAVLPTDLAIWHPVPEQVPAWQVAGAAVILLSITTVALWSWRSMPCLMVGWLWFIVGLAPVITLRDIAWAERFMYLPLIGLSMFLAWSLPTRWLAEGRRSWITVGITMILAAGMAAGTWRQCTYWQNSITLFERAIRVTRNNAFAQSTLGGALMHAGRVKEAMPHLFEAMSISPEAALDFNSVASLFSLQAQDGQTIGRLNRVLRQNLALPETHNNLGCLLAQEGRIAEAKEQFIQALHLNPDYPHAHNNLGYLLAREGRLDEAKEHLMRALRFQTAYANAHCGLAEIMAAQGQPKEALSHCLQALSIDPYRYEAQHIAASLLASQGRVKEAIVHDYKAFQIKPDYVPSLNALAWYLSTDPDPATRDGRQAVRLAEKARILVSNRDYRPLISLAAAYAETGRFKEAVAVANQAMDLARTRGDKALLEQLKKHMEFYRKNAPYRQACP